MKTILTAALLLMTAFMVAPSATACEVSDPTGTTYTCVDQYEYSYGTCEEGSDGYDYSSTYAYSYIPGTAQAGASTWDYCYSSSWWNQFQEGEGQSAYAYVYPTGTYAGAGHYEYTGDFEYCDTYVYHNAGGSWTYESLGCL